MNPKTQRTILKQSRIFGYSAAVLSIPFAFLGGMIASCCPFGVLVGAIPLLITSGLGAQLAAIFLDYSVVSKRNSTGAGLRVGVRSATISALAGGILTLFTASHSLSAMTAAAGAGAPDGSGVGAAITIGLMNLLMLLVVVAFCALIAIVPGVIGAAIRGSAAQDSEPVPEPSWEAELKSLKNSSLIEWGILLGLLAAAAFVIPVIQQYSMGKSNREAGNYVTAAPSALEVNIGREQNRDPQPEPVGEILATLVNDNAIFTLTNVGGGIKYVEFKDHGNAGRKSQGIHANRFGIAPIGGLINAQGIPENYIHHYMNGQSSTNKSIILISKLQSDLIVKKTFTLSSLGRPGDFYLVDLALMIENAGPEEQNIGQWSIFAGEASPRDPSEKAELTGFLWGGGGRTNFRSSSSFGRGVSGQQQAIFSTSDNSAEYAGVTNQFFITAIRAQKSSLGKSWARKASVMLPDATHPAISVSAGLTLPEVTLAPSSNITLNYQIYAGPKSTQILETIGDDWGTILKHSATELVD